MVTCVCTWACWECPNIIISAQSKQDLCSHVGPRLGSQQTRLRNTHTASRASLYYGMPHYYHTSQLKQIPFKFKQYLRLIYYLLTVYDTRSGLPSMYFSGIPSDKPSFFLEIRRNTGSLFISPSMFVTPQCLIAVIWVTVPCHDTYQSLSWFVIGGSTSVYKVYYLIK